ncbi:MAG: phosphate/phosphite/phosphonate ABC transporter substrate-binding protein [Sandaracinaceae bacterium]|nr:phosphate/phosphite/phosphonate ABC transporter substrate-binding protein [Sandaracinaceae bacterium]
MERLIFGTGPVRLGADGVKTRSGLGAHLTKVLGLPVRVVAAASYADLLGQLSRGEVHLAWMSPALALNACDELEAMPLVSAVRSPGAQFYGTLYVRADSNMKTPEDLRGKKIAWVDTDSCSGYLFPRIALAAEGIDVPSFFGEEKLLGSHDAVGRAVAQRAADVGATYMNVDDDAFTGSTILAGWCDVTTDPMRTILRTDPIPSDMVIASRELDAGWREKALRALTSLHEDPDVVRLVKHLFGAIRFEPAQLARYDIVRRAMRT